ncbi:MAG: hypothetical protein R3B48_22245 [Kofleriaceae bacterium]
MPDQTLEFELTLDETNTILEALGALPFARVYAMIGRIQEQARKQLAEPAPSSSAPSSAAPASNGAPQEPGR